MLTASRVLNSNVSLIGEEERHRTQIPNQRQLKADQSECVYTIKRVSIPSVDAVSDSLSLATTATEGTVGEVWERKQYSAMPLGCSIHNPPTTLTDLPGSGKQPSEKDLYEFLKEAQLEHYYSVLTRHLKIRSVQQIKYVEDSDLSELGFSRPEQRRLRKYFKRECPQTAMWKLRKRLTRSTSGRCSSSRLKDAMDGLSTTKNVNVLSISLDSTPTSEDGDSKRRTLMWSPKCSSNEPEKVEEKNADGNNYSTYKTIYPRILLPHQLEIGSSLGEGEFGKVYQGVWHTDSGSVVQVAIKILENQQFTDPTTNFLNEIALMHKLDHPDIVQFYGVCIESDSLKIVTELAPLRSLLECLRESELRPNFSVPILHRFCIQIARGMSYLEDCGLVHRDLAARNILVFTKDVVKISDFGMSRALHLGKSYYQSNFNMNLKLPIAWCAPECIHDLLFTSASDIWAYGVTLWEMFTYGFTPWAGLTGKQVLEMIDTPKYGRLEQPDSCPDPIYDAIMRACWAHEPKARPTFNQLLGMLPRLSPERWITTSEYRPELDSSLDSFSTNEELQFDPSYHHLSTNRSITRPLFIRSNETVCVLGKSYRNSKMWKVVNLRTGLVGCIPSSILRPYSSQELTLSRDSTLNQNVTYMNYNNNNNNNNNYSINNNSLSSPKSSITQTRLRMSRRASLSDLAFRKTVSRFSSKLSGISIDLNSNPFRRSRLTADQISLPQNDFRHIGHVGSDGRTFGELGLVANVIDSKDDLTDSQLFEDLDDYSEKLKDKTNYSQQQFEIHLPDSNSSKISHQNESIIDNQIIHNKNNNHSQNDHYSCSKDTQSEFEYKSNLMEKSINLDHLFDDIKLDLNAESNGSSLFDEVLKQLQLNTFESKFDTPKQTNEQMKDKLNIELNKEETIDNESKEIPTTTTTTLSSSSATVKSNNDECTVVEFMQHKPLVTTPPLKSKFSKFKSDLLPPRQDDLIGRIIDTRGRSRSRNLMKTKSELNDNSIVPTKTKINTMEINKLDDQINKSKSNSIWKRSSLSSLTRRSLSISNTNNGSDETNGRFEQKRLTISKPILLNRPISSTQSKFSQHPPSISSNLTSICGLTDPNSSATTTSRNSSLTIVSSTNGGGINTPSLNSNNQEPIDIQSLSSSSLLLLTNDLNHISSDLNSMKINEDEIISTNSISISPAPSLSSMTSVPVCLTTMHRNSNYSTNSTLSTGIGSGTINNSLVNQNCLRALRTGDVIFRASTTSSTATLNQRRNKTNSSKLNNNLHDEQYVNNSKLPNSPTIHQRSMNLLSSPKLTNNNNNNLIHTNEKSPNRKKPITHISCISSSSSSSTSSPSTPSPLNSTLCLQTSNNQSRSGQSAKFESEHSDKLSNHSDFDNVMTSFFGTTFANFLDNSTCGNDYQLTKHQTNYDSSNSKQNVKNSSFTSSLTGVAFHKRYEDSVEDDDDVMAI